MLCQPRVDYTIFLRPKGSSVSRVAREPTGRVILKGEVTASKSVTSPGTVDPVEERTLLGSRWVDRFDIVGHIYIKASVFLDFFDR